MNLRIYQESENVIIVLENAISLKDKIVPFLEKDVLAYIDGNRLILEYKNNKMEEQLGKLLLLTNQSQNHTITYLQDIEPQEDKDAECPNLHPEQFQSGPFRNMTPQMIYLQEKEKCIPYFVESLVNEDNVLLIEGIKIVLKKYLVQAFPRMSRIEDYKQWLTVWMPLIKNEVENAFARVQATDMNIYFKKTSKDVIKKDFQLFYHRIMSL